MPGAVVFKGSPSYEKDSMENNNRINDLLHRYINRQISSAELEELLLLTGEFSAESPFVAEPVLRQLWEDARSGNLPSTAQDVDWEGVYRSATAENSGQEPAKVVILTRPRRWLAAAAVLAIAASLVAIWYSRPARPVQIPVARHQGAVVEQTIHPGGNNAVLTLGDGSQLVLDSTLSGVIGNDAGTEISRTTEGGLVYRPDAATKTVFNTVTTPRAAQCKITLPDGSKVWLNAASFLRFPTHFQGNERVVELRGEGYFEVAKNAAMPFRVVVAPLSSAENGLEVKVLGTHFNIMAYPDEGVILATLLEGSVQLIKGSQQKMLKPGRQGSVAPGSDSIRVSKANAKMAVAWKEGYFYFDKANVQYILRQIGRWYDLDIVYAGKAPDLVFSGKIERDLPLKGILHLLEQGNIRFRIENRKMIVTQ